jgi:hypothetical protein
MIHFFRFIVGVIGGGHSFELVSSSFQMTLSEPLQSSVRFFLISGFLQITNETLPEFNYTNIVESLGPCYTPDTIG